MDRLANGADGLGEACDIMLARHIAGFKMHFRDTQVIALDEAVENFGEEAPLLFAEPPGNAKIDGDDIARRIDEEIARMHVGMEEAVAQCVAQEGLDQQRADGRKIVASGGEALKIVHLDAVDPFHRQHIAARALPIDRGNAEARIVFGVVAQLRQSRRFEPQVHFDAGGLGQRLGHFHRLQAARVGDPFLLQAGDEEVTFKIIGEALAHAGADDFDRDFFRRAVFHDFGGMHLRDGGGGDGVVKRNVKIIDAAADGILDHLAGLRRRERIHLVLQPRQVLRQLFADNVGTRGEELAELDIGRAEAADGASEALLARS